uniref:DZF domain-containing protein n=1 Tax=Parascaris univalens TaxID=6257 RepID=A0A915BLQ4_PARUN
MYGFTGQNQYGSYNSTYATSPAAAVYSAVQSQQTPHTPTLGAVGATNPTSVYASFSNAAAAAAPSASPYAAAAAYAATPSAAAAYAQYGQTAAAVAAVQQQQQLQAATGVVSASAAGYGAHTAATRLTDSYSTVGTVPSTGGTYTSLADYTNTLRTAAAAAAVANPTSNSSFVGVTRIGTTSSNPLTNTASSVSGTSTAAASSYLQSKVAGTTNVWMGATKKASAAAGFGSTNASYATTPSTNVTVAGVGRGQPGTKGRGAFPNKRYGGQSRPVGDIQQFYCEVCKISCAGSQTYKEHVEGQKHKKKEALQKGEGQTLSKSRVSFRCETCNVTCTGKDTYESHIRGSKHQKTANLMKKLGKPVPETPTVLAPGEKSNSSASTTNGAPISTVGGPAVPTKRVVGIPTVSFVGGQKLQTSETAVKSTGAADAALEAAGQKNAAVEAALAAEKDVQPVGEDYVEEERNASGKLVQYNCKLCDCKFSDPNAKNIHIKGRKHRLQYKLKVNPDLVVDVKPNQMPREMRNELARKMRAHVGPPMMMPRPYGPPQPLMVFPHAPARPWFGMMDPGRRAETSEDRHVMAKHKQIYPDEAQLAAVEKLVAMIEKALKGVSDDFAAKDMKAEGTTPAASDVKNEAKETVATSTPAIGGAPQRDRLLKGVMRVGLLAKGLLIKTDKEVQLVVLCSQPPTRTLLSQVAKLLPDHLEKGENDIVTVLEKADESALLVKQSDNDMICRIVLSAVTLREEAIAENGSKQAGDKPAAVKDPLPRGPCLDALAELRHAKWFQARCANLQSAGITLRIFREIRQRIPAWQPLSTWATELFVEKVLASHGAPLSPGDAVRRVFEAIASGVLFSSGPGLKDPCEKDGRDVLADLSGQQREDITAGSQHALRLIAFNQMYKVLGVERLPDARAPPLSSLGDRKRPRDSNGSPDDGEVVDMKKEKKEEAKGEEKSTA